MLSRAGILQAQRGVGGGYLLVRAPADISVLDVLNATAGEVTRITRCPLGIPGHARLCALHRLLDDQAAGAERVFGQTTIESLLRQDDMRQPLCRVPGTPVPTDVRISGGGWAGRRDGKRD
jgi:Rrf2 family protein